MNSEEHETNNEREEQKASVAKMIIMAKSNISNAKANWICQAKMLFATATS